MSTCLLQVCLSHSVAYWDQRRCGLTLTSGNMSSVSSCPQLCLPCCWKVFTPPPPTLTETGICEESNHANFQQFISLQHHLRAIFQKVTLISLSWKHCLTTMLKFVNFPYVVPNMCHFLLFKTQKVLKNVSIVFNKYNGSQSTLLTCNFETMRLFQDIFFLCSTEERKSYSYGMTWRWVN